MRKSGNGGALRRSSVWAGVDEGFDERESCKRIVTVPEW